MNKIKHVMCVEGFAPFKPEDSPLFGVPIVTNLDREVPMFESLETEACLSLYFPWPEENDPTAWRHLTEHSELWTELIPDEPLAADGNPVWSDFRIIRDKTGDLARFSTFMLIPARREQLVRAFTKSIDGAFWGMTIVGDLQPTYGPPVYAQGLSIDFEARKEICSRIVVAGRADWVAKCKEKICRHFGADGLEFVDGTDSEAAERRVREYLLSDGPRPPDYSTYNV